MSNEKSYVMDSIKKGNARATKYKNKIGYSFTLDIFYIKDKDWKKKNIYIMPNEISNVIDVLNYFKLDGN